MKTIYAFVLLAFLGLLILGCSESSDQLVVPVDKISSLNTGGSLEKGVIHSATGSAHWRVIGYQSQVRFSFSAIKHKDGSVTGQVRNNDEGQTYKFHGEVYDLQVEGNMAKICFTFRSGKWNPPGGPVIDLTGALGCVVVVDNGESNEIDKVSLIWWDFPGTTYPPWTVEEIFAMNITDYINTVLDLFGLTYDEFIPDIEYGSVKVR
jgi:hypothetical protein